MVRLVPSGPKAWAIIAMTPRPRFDVAHGLAHPAGGCPSLSGSLSFSEMSSAIQTSTYWRERIVPVGIMSSNGPNDKSCQTGLLGPHGHDPTFRFGPQVF